MIAEDIIKEMGAPDDYSNRMCTCFFNQKAMCCSREIVSQRAIYLALVMALFQIADLEPYEITEWVNL